MDHRSHGDPPLLLTCETKRSHMQSIHIQIIQHFHTKTGLPGECSKTWCCRTFHCNNWYTKNFHKCKKALHIMVILWLQSNQGRCLEINPCYTKPKNYEQWNSDPLMVSCCVFWGGTCSPVSQGRPVKSLGSSHQWRTNRWTPEPTNQSCMGVGAGPNPLRVGGTILNW